jgi:outer membrane protein assembly factor BamB
MPNQIRLLAWSVGTEGIDQLRKKFFETTVDLQHQWPMERHDIAHTGSDGVTVKPPLQLKWLTAIEEGKSISSPVASKGLVYVGCSDSILALNVETGEEKWRFKTEGQVREAAAVVGELLYFACSNSRIYALDAQSGEMRWVTKTRGEPHSPSIVDDFLYAAVSDSFICCLRKATGEECWLVDTNDKIWSSPTPHAGALFAGTKSCLCAYDQASGRLKWRFPASSAIIGSPAVSNDVVYALMANGVLLGIGVDNGRPVWEWPGLRLGGLAGFTSPAISRRGVVYAVTHESLFGLWVHAINRAAPYDRMKLWEWINEDFKTHQDWLLTSSPALVEGFVFVAACLGSYLYGLDAMSGKKIWEYKTRGHVHSSPCAVAGRVYISDLSGTLYALAPKQ